MWLHPLTPLGAIVWVHNLIVNVLGSITGMDAAVIAVSTYIWYYYPTLSPMTKWSNRMTLTMLHRLLHPLNYYHDGGFESVMCMLASQPLDFQVWKGILVLPVWMKQEDWQNLCYTHPVLDTSVTCWDIDRPNRLNGSDRPELFPWLDIAHRLHAKYARASHYRTRHTASSDETTQPSEPIVFLKVQKVPVGRIWGQRKPSNVDGVKQIQTCWRIVLGIFLSEVITLSVMGFLLGNLKSTTGFSVAARYFCAWSVLLPLLTKYGFAFVAYLDLKRVDFNDGGSPEPNNSVGTKCNRFASDRCLLEMNVCPPAVRPITQHKVRLLVQYLILNAMYQHGVWIYLLATSTKTTIALLWITLHVKSMISSLSLGRQEREDCGCFQETIAAKLMARREVIVEGLSMLRISAEVHMVTDEEEREKMLQSMVMQGQEKSEPGHTRGEQIDDSNAEGRASEVSQNVTAKVDGASRDEAGPRRRRAER